MSIKWTVKKWTVSILFVRLDSDDHFGYKPNESSNVYHCNRHLQVRNLRLSANLSYVCVCYAVYIIILINDTKNIFRTFGIALELLS